MAKEQKAPTLPSFGISLSEPAVSLVTTTGGRPEAFALCAKWMTRQTFPGPIQWVIVDDVDPETPLPTLPLRITGLWKITSIRPERKWKEGKNTQRRNLVAGLSAATAPVIMIIEDDDYYSPDYITQMLKLLGDHQIAGEAGARYYNVKERLWRNMPNREHASLSQTVFKSSCKRMLIDAANSGSLWFDVMFWDYAIKNGTPCVLRHPTSLVVGIKGLPGRRGIGLGHTDDVPDYTKDPRLDVLKTWIGKDAGEYWKFSREGK
jgi:hypothetical protein